jgi:hypothetical protein
MSRWLVLAGIVVLVALLLRRLTRKKPPSDELFRP